jgi:UPF0176 protein
MNNEKKYTTYGFTASFYHFLEIPEPEYLKASLTNFCLGHKLIGTIVIAHEGLNGSVEGSLESVNNLLIFIKNHLCIENMTTNIVRSPIPSFKRLKVKIRKEIVSIGLEGIDPGTYSGKHVSHHQWNQLLLNPDVVVIDTRNDYEIDIGTFESASRPKTQNFREFPEKVEDMLGDDLEKPIAMFCTGGIRCEKASSLLVEKGYKQVFQLDGGILNYLKSVEPDQSLWRGDCFVFDDRVAVNGRLEPANYEKCHGCRKPLSSVDRQSPLFEYGITCHHCAGSLDEERRASLEERHKQTELTKQRNK